MRRTALLEEGPLANYIAQRTWRDASLGRMALAGACASVIGCTDAGPSPSPNTGDAAAPDAQLPEPTAGTGGDAGWMEIDPSRFDGKETFRHDTLGDERFWTDQLRMHEVIQSAVDPMTALSVGLKVDAEALPAGILEQVDLTDPATTVALLELGAVVGVEGVVEDGELVSVGVTCALCHSDVDDSVMEGIGKRLDGYANLDLDPGMILSLSPYFDDAAKAVLTSWGKGRYDARWNQDGINEPTVIPPIYGLKDVDLETFTGDGPVSYWNSYVAVTQMGAVGQFFDPRIDVAVFRVPDQVTPKLPALYDYQISLAAPEPDADAFDAAAAERGKALFEGDATCSTCHYGPLLSDVNDDRLHAPEETGMDEAAAERSATGKYRTTPLRALLQHPPYFHDGSAETLADVVDHYDDVLNLALSGDEQNDLTEYLKSL